MPRRWPRSLASSSGTLRSRTAILQCNCRGRGNCAFTSYEDRPHVEYPSIGDAELILITASSQRRGCESRTVYLEQSEGLENIIHPTLLASSQEMSQPTVKESYVDVLIIGAGPSGLMCANALVHAGVKVRIIDRRCVPRSLLPADTELNICTI